MNGPINHYLSSKSEYSAVVSMSIKVQLLQIIVLNYTQFYLYFLLEQVC